jgi:hypothetical protein
MSHPIAPPPELVQQWLGEYFGCTVSGELSDSERFLATRAAQWGADQELEACIDWMKRMGYWGDDGKAIPAFRAARRPKPLSLKEQAMRVLLECGYTLGGRMELEPEDIDIIHRALEQLND